MPPLFPLKRARAIALAVTLWKITKKLRLAGAGALAVGLGLLGLALRLHALGAPSVSFYDELTTLARSLAPGFGDVVRAVRWQYPPYIDFQPPLYYLVVHAFIGLGATDFFARLPAALSGALSVPLLYAVGRRLGGRATGLFAAAALAVNLHHIDVSQQTRLYAFSGLLSLGAILALLRALSANTSTPSGKRAVVANWTGYGLFLVLGLYTSYLGAAWIVAGGLLTGLALVWPGPPAPLPAVPAEPGNVAAPGNLPPRKTAAGPPHPRRTIFFGCALASGAAIAAFLPWLGASAGVRGYLLVAAVPDQPPLLTALTQIFSAFSSQYAAFTGRPELPWLLAGPALAGILIGLARRRTRFAAIACTLWFGALFFPVWLKANATHHFQARYVLPCLFPVLLAAGGLPAALCELLPRRLPGKNAVSLVLASLLGLALAYPSLPVYPFFYRRDDSRLKTLAAFLHDRAGPGMALDFVGHAPPWTHFYFDTFVRWYLPGVFASSLPQAGDRGFRQCLVVTPGEDKNAPPPIPGATFLGRLARVAVYRAPLINATPLLVRPDAAGKVFFTTATTLPQAFSQIHDSNNIRLRGDGLLPANRFASGSATYALRPLPGQRIALTRLLLDAKVTGYPGIPVSGRVLVLVGSAPDRLAPYDPGALPPAGETLYVRLILEPGPRRETVVVTRLALAATVSGTPAPGIAVPEAERHRLEQNTLVVPADPTAVYPEAHPLATVPAGTPDAVATIGQTAFIDPTLSPTYGHPVPEKPLTLVNPGTDSLPLATWKLSGAPQGPQLTLGETRFTIPLAGKNLTATLNAQGTGTVSLCPLFTPDGFDPALADSAPGSKRSANEPALTCQDAKPCSITYALVTGYPAQTLHLTWFPRIFSDPAGKNSITASFSTDGRTYHPLDSLTSSGSGRWEGLGVTRLATADLNGFTGTLRLRFSLSGDAAQLWSSLETPTALRLSLDTKTLPALTLPPGNTPLRVDCPTPQGMLGPALQVLPGGKLF